MLLHKTDIPATLVDAAYSGSLVIFAGAGVSMQAPLEFPSFDSLVEAIREDVDPANRLRKRRETEGGDGNVIFRESPEQYLSYLESEGRQIREACANHLLANGRTCELHSNLLRLFPGKHPIRIVTTNFDDAFENAACAAGRDCPVYNSPALPLGSDVVGLVHLHGTTRDVGSMVLTAEDYGKAYVTIGWASRFLVELFKTYTVLFVGYSCGDSLVDYLTRSVSGDMSGNAFALCRETDETHDWQMRGVQPVTFKDFEDLPQLIDEWASYLEQSLTDRVQELKRLGAIPELSPGQCDYLVHSLRWSDEDDRALFAREFCQQSSCFGHLKLLHERGLTGFFSSAEPSGSDYALLHWVVSRFSIGRCNDLQSLCFRIHNELSVHFYEQLCWNLVSMDAPSTAIGPWIAWLETAPYHYHVRCARYLVRIASSSDNPDIVFSILKMMLKVGVSFSDSAIFGPRQEPIIPVDDSYFEEQLLSGLKRHRDAIGERLFDYCFGQIELAYSIQTNCWTDGGGFDGLSFSRSSIETHEQDRHASGVDGILINITRESVGQDMAGSAARKCLASKCNLLVRLGLWIIKEYSCSGECLHLVANMGYLENAHLHHEVFHLIRASFEIATQEQRNEFTDYLRELYAKRDDSDYECFNICSWILDTVDDPALQEMQMEVLSKHPNYLKRKHQDFNHYTSCGLVDNSAECKIGMADFTVESLLQRLEQMDERQPHVRSFDIVSVPANDYPDLAVSMLNELLGRVRSDKETELCKLLVSTIGWDSPDIPHESAYELLIAALSDEKTCASAVDALWRNDTYPNDGKDWTQEELERLLLAASQNLPALLKKESALALEERPDWVSVGINHPAGKYLELIVKLENLALSNDTTNKVALSLLKKLDILSLPESSVAKMLVACFFASFDTWVASDIEYSRSVAALLTDESWTQTPSWQGIAHLPQMSKEAWDLTADGWKVLFAGRVTIDDRLHDSLVKLYVWLTVIRAGREDRGKMLRICASASGKSLQVACMCIDNWLGTIEGEDQVLQWNTWLSSSLEYLASDSHESRKTVAGLYCRWIRTLPSLRKGLVEALERDCPDLRDRDIFVHEGTLKDVSDDSNLTVAEKAKTIVFLLEHQRHFINEEEARIAALQISLGALDDALATRLKDAYTRCGMCDVVFRE